MSDKINIRINKATYDKIKNIKQWYNLSNKTNESQMDVIDHIVSAYIKKNSLDYLEQEVDEADIESHDNILKSCRVDTHLPESNKEKILNIQSFLQSQNMKKKVTINDVIITVMDKYIELYPEIKQISIKTKFIKQKVLFEKVKKDWKNSRTEKLI